MTFTMIRHKCKIKTPVKVTDSFTEVHDGDVKRKSYIIHSINRLLADTG